MSFQAANGFDPTQLPIILDKIPVAVTVIDLDGHILYYNAYSSKVLDRKPEYLGRDVRFCHQKPESNAKIDRMLEEFKSGRRQEFYYEADRYGKRIAVTFAPLEIEGRLVGCIQSVIVVT
jgi:DUF438 domain-containing protein